MCGPQFQYFSAVFRGIMNVNEVKSDNFPVSMSVHEGMQLELRKLVNTYTVRVIKNIQKHYLE